LPKLKLVLDTQRRSLRFTQYDPDIVMVPFDHAGTLVEAFHRQKATIDSDRHLTPEGKVAARIKTGNSSLSALKAWHEPRLQGLDADLLAQRAALMSSAQRPDPRRVELMSTLLLKHSPHDIAVFYNSATDEERRCMEAASAAVGRVPMVTPKGKEWHTLLDANMVNEAIMARAAVTNPTAAAKVQELAEIRAMQVTVAGVAASEIRDALSDYKLDED
jgi:hypothetical protein